MCRTAAKPPAAHGDDRRRQRHRHHQPEPALVPVRLPVSRYPFIDTDASASSRTWPRPPRCRATRTGACPADGCRPARRVDGVGTFTGVSYTNQESQLGAPAPTYTIAIVGRRVSSTTNVQRIAAFHRIASATPMRLAESGIFCVGGLMALGVGPSCCCIPPPRRNAGAPILRNLESHGAASQLESVISICHRQKSSMARRLSPPGNSRIACLFHPHRRPRDAMECMTWDSPAKTT